VANTYAAGSTPSQSPLFDKTYRIDETLDQHIQNKSSLTYSLDFAAEPGSKIVSARFIEDSATAVSEKNLNISADRTKVTFTFRLESGPFYDRWRGWWHGQVVLTMQRVPQALQPSVNNCD
jgi:hypothetical protein